VLYYVKFSELGFDDFRVIGDIKVIMGSVVGDIPRNIEDTG
jgi:hypothetical protein